jgi:hypothetical protein
MMQPTLALTEPSILPCTKEEVLQRSSHSWLGELAGNGGPHPLEVWSALEGLGVIEEGRGEREGDRAKGNRLGPAAASEDG